VGSIPTLGSIVRIFAGAKITSLLFGNRTQPSRCEASTMGRFIGAARRFPPSAVLSGLFSFGLLPCAELTLLHRGPLTNPDYAAAPPLSRRLAVRGQDWRSYHPTTWLRQDRRPLKGRTSGGNRGVATGGAIPILGILTIGRLSRLPDLDLRYLQRVRNLLN